MGVHLSATGISIQSSLCKLFIQTSHCKPRVKSSILTMENYGQYLTKLLKTVLIFNERNKVRSLAQHSNKKLTTWIKIPEKQHRAQATRYLLCAYRNAVFLDV